MLLSTFASLSGSAAAAMTPENLRCEYRSDPLGVDNPRPRLSWTLKSDGKDEIQASYRVLVASSRASLDRNQGDLWDSGTVSSDQQNNIAYSGKLLVPGQVCHWKVAVASRNSKPVWSRPATWEMGLIGVQAWAARWIEDSRPEAQPYQDDPAPLFRKEFSAKSQVVRARLYITGLGYYEASLNGKRVGDHVLDPGWTDVDKRVSYSVYDVTKLLSSGTNCLGVMVGNGWYNPLPLKLFGTFNLREHLTIGRPRLIAQLKIEYRDGSIELIGTDPSWRVGDGPIVRNNIYLGEVYDARREVEGWDHAGFDDSTWRKAVVAKGEVGDLIAQPQPPIRVTEQWTAVKVTEPKPGVFIYDMGVNFAGWASFKFDLTAGTQIKMRYGELLHKDGTLNPMTSVAGQIKRKGVGGPGAPDIAWQSDTFISKGGKETYTPRFTFHGFRYVEVTGLPKALPLNAVTAMRLNSDVEDVGTFECSNPLLNDIQAMCIRTFKSNIFSVQSDCPHRERLAYGGDIVATSEALMSNFDMAGFYEKAVRDWSDSALPNGMFTDTAPFMGIHYCGVIWAMAHPLLIEQLHQYYGNRQIGAEQYEAAKRWLTLVEKQYPDGIVKEGLSDHEGLAPAPAPEMVTPLYFQCAQMLAKLARRLGHSADAQHFDDLAAKIRAEYGKRFIDVVTGKVGPGTQASQSIALYTGIAPEAAGSKIFDFLVKNIESHKGHLTTGILGTKFMLEVLSREGRADLAYKIVTQPEFPGWGWMLKNGATTLWEHWEFSDNTFSHNHPMFGSVSQWMMQQLGGIRPDADAVGYDRIVIQPQTPEGLDWVKSSYQSVRGKIVSNWKRQGKKLEFEITIPANTRARIVLPEGAVLENGKPLARKIEDNGLAVGSGRYVFSVSIE
jgi:alpha-L-rhamnosidase